MRSLRVAGHPVHPLLVHFPAALWPTSLLWDILSYWPGGSVWAQMSFWCIALGLAVAVLAVTTGFMEYALLPDNHPAQKTAVAHMMVMFGATTAYTASLLARGTPSTVVEPSALAVGLSIAGLVLLAAGGWLGGTLVYRYHVGSANGGTD